MRRPFVLVAAIVLVGCSSATTSSATTSSATPPPSGPPVRLAISAPKGATFDGFSTGTLTAPAGSPITIVFRNTDPGVQHNVQIFPGDVATGTPVFAPAGNAMITGPATARYVVGALPAGTYTFDCYAHPATMVGTLTVG
ncbi:MAG TPA: cupredoxin domain-containing protein [Actinomycetota bacterium]|nr:cupredoxin domain-containing protein [Actinomycetota bacterium]